MMEWLAWQAFGFVIFIIVLVALENVSIWDTVKYEKHNAHATQNKNGEADDGPEEAVLIAIVRRIDAIGNHLRAQNEQEDRHDKSRSCREKVTILALGASAAFLLVQLIDAHLASDKQHEDTLAALKIAEAANATTTKSAASQIAEMAKQSAVMQDQLSASFPAKIKIVDIHIWNKGEGSPMNPKNRLPTFEGGTIIEGAALAVNFGRESVTVVESDIFAKFHRSPLTMNYPGWGDPGQNGIRPFDHGNPPGYPFIDIPSGGNELVPNVSQRWKFEVTVPVGDDRGDLYVFGNIVYKDRLGTLQGVYFNSRYDSIMGRFVPGGLNRFVSSEDDK